MKYISLLVTFLIILIIQSNGQAPVTEWQKNLGGNDQEVANSLQQTVDGGYIVSGSSISANGDVKGNHGNNNYRIVKLNSLGVIEWNRSLGGSNNDKANTIEQKEDGGTIVAGFSTSADGDITKNNSGKACWVVKLSSTGNIQWEKSFEGNSETYAIRQTTENYVPDLRIVKLRGGACVPSINITASTTTICAGTPVTFTATAINGGTTPRYQWKVNGANAGTNSITYTSATLKNDDNITCELTSNASCGTTTNVTSNSVRLTVNPIPVVSISGDTCMGSVLTANSNISPASLKWTLNGSTTVSDQTAGIETNAVTVAGGNGIGNNPNQLNRPTRFFVNASGDMYIPDMDNNRIVKWAPGATSGVTVAGGNGAGSGPNQFDRPTSVVFDSEGNMYVADQNNDRVQKFAPGATSGVSFGTYFSTPTDLFIDADDNLYISEQHDYRVVKYASVTTSNSPQGVTVAGGFGPGSGAEGLTSPTGIFVDASGNIYICDTDNDRVQKWAPGATSGVTVAGGNGHGSELDQLANPLGVFVDSNGDIYIADYNNARVQKWPAGATYGTTVAGGIGAGSGTDQLDHPESVWLNENGDLIVTDLSNHRIQKFTNTLSKKYTTLEEGIYTATATAANGCTTTSNAIKVVTSKTPQISIVSDATAACLGITVKFIATPADGGSEPLFQWRVNGSNAGTNSNNPAYSSSTLKGGDIVSCVMTSNATHCITTNTVVSNSITMSTASPGIASVTIKTNDSVTCSDAVINFIANPVHGGTDPTFRWMVNGIPAAANNATFSTTSLKDLDVVTCTITSNANLCPGNLSATSNAVTIHILPAKEASVQITANDTLICTGSMVQFTATSSNGGLNPVYQWKVNGVNTGANNIVFGSNTLKDGDVVSCTMTSDAQCVVSPVPSNNISISVDQVPVITIRPDTIILAGSSIRLNTFVTGNNLTYEWSPQQTLSDPTTISPIATPLTTTTYRLLVTTTGGCTAKSQVTITPIQSIVIANAFSPNNDGVNDVWRIPGLAADPDCTVEIFNRYGRLLYRSKGYKTPWNGTYNGTSLPVATYYYIITTKMSGTKSGAVTILK